MAGARERARFLPGADDPDNEKGQGQDRQAGRRPQGQSEAAQGSGSGTGRRGSGGTASSKGAGDGASGGVGKCAAEGSQCRLKSQVGKRPEETRETQRSPGTTQRSQRHQIFVTF